MPKEATMWSWMRNGLREYGHLVRVENLIHPGTPDVNYAIQGVDGWIELKSAAAIPRRVTTAVFGSSYNLTPEQIEWLVQRSKYSSTAWIAARAGEFFWLVPAHHAPEFNAATMKNLGERARFSHKGSMDKRRWAVLAQTLAERKPT